MKSFDKLFIGGQWASPSSRATIDVVSPFTEEVIASAPAAAEADVDRAVEAARQAFDTGPWPHMTAAERAEAMRRLLALLQERSDELATTISTEMGCPLGWSIFGQSLSATMVLDFYCNLLDEYAFEELRTGLLGPVLVRQEAIGVVAAIAPWNVPLFVIMLKLAPALATGCTSIVKPAPETPIDALMLAECVEAAGLPAGVVNVIPAGREVSEYLVRHRGVDKVGFTGSTAVGRRIGAICGEQLKRCTLELGGKSAAILLDDVDLDATVAPLVGAGILNNGEACGAQTRILAPRSRYGECVDALASFVSNMSVGDPLDPTIAVGPLVAERQRARVEGYIEAGKAEGATLAVGGGRPAAHAKGWFVEPTLFTDVDNHMKIAREEIFGPVLVVIPYDDDEDAVRIANDSDYGLSGTVWSSDVDRGLGVARKVRTGTYSVNYFMIDFGAPFGGYKCSGVGRELGPEGLRAYLEYKSIALPAGYEAETVA